MRALMTFIVVAVAVLAAGPAVAQQIDIEASRPPAAREPRVVPPPLHYESTRPSDADYYPQGTRVEHDPAFIEPLAGHYETPTQSGRFGLSAWTAPNTPVGAQTSGVRDVTGWAALGFSVTWGGPPPRPAAARRAVR